jgi:hypothetical protein
MASTIATTVSAEEEEEEEKQQAIAFDKTTERGVEGGLFQACMKSIRSTHASANRLRTGLVVAGLFTDQAIYREAIVMFYAATRALEQKLAELKDQDEICSQLLALGYRFAPQYEKDLQVLFSPESWNQDVQKTLETSSDGAKAYLQKIKSMQTGAELAGAAFCLWGALIIGGGAAAKPRVESLCGKEAINLFRDVTGPGRGERKTKFVQFWDGLASREDPSFAKIVEVSQDCMQGNNALIISVKTNPWWLQYALSTAVGVAGIVLYFLLKQFSR